MAKNAVVPPAVASPRPSTPQVRRDQMVASSKPADSAAVGGTAGAPTATVDANSKVREGGGKLDQSANTAQSVEVAGTAAARQQTNVPAVAARCENKPTVDESQKTTTIELNCPEAPAVPVQHAESADALDGATSTSLKKVKSARGKIILTPDGTVVWRLGGGGFIERSVVSGTTWVRQNTGASRELLAGSAPSDVVCWVVGRAGAILLSTDGGGHWNKIVSPIGGDVMRVVAADGLHAVIWDVRGASFATADAGKSWSVGKQ